MHIKCTLIAGITLLLFSCTSTKNIQTQQSNTDSLYKARMEDSLRLLAAYRESYENVIANLTETGVVFENEPCPNLDSIFSVLDKENRARVDSVIAKENIKVKSLSNKLEVAADGSFKAEGRIAAYKRTEEKYQKEIQAKDFAIDLLNKRLKEKEVELSKKTETKVKDVKRRSLFGGYAMAFGGGALCMFLFLLWFNKKRKVKSTIMNKVTLFILTMLTLTSCDSHDKPTDNISFGQAWGYAATFGSYWLWLVLALLGCGAAGWFLQRNYSKSQNWSGGQTAIVVVLLALFLAALLATPASIAANTTVEQAARGVYIR